MINIRFGDLIDDSDLQAKISKGQKLIGRVWRYDEKKNEAYVSYTIGDEEDEWCADMELSYLRENGVNVERQGEFEMGQSKENPLEVYLKPIPEKVLTEEEKKEIEEEIDRLWKDLGGSL